MLPAAITERTVAITNHGTGFLREPWFWLALAAGAGSCVVLAWSTGGLDMPVQDNYPWRYFGWLAMVYPLAEEWLFRGMMQPWLLRRLPGRVAWSQLSLANISVSAVFVAGHYLASTDPWVLLVMLPSLVLGWFRDRYDSVIPGALLHCAFNMAYFLSFGLPATRVD